MKKDKSNPEKYRNIRKEAEKLLRKQPETQTENLSVEETGRTLHELHVHQIELEMQNDELRRVQTEFEESSAKYSDLYDFSPVGYFTVNNKGLILEANLTVAGQLGVERSLLIKKPFSRFIARDYKDLFYIHLIKGSNTTDRQSCEIKIKRGDSSELYAQLESIPVEDSKGNRLYRTSLIDITGRKQAEEAESTLLQELKSIFENLPVGIVYLDNEFRIISSNRVFNDIAGLQEKELKGKICYEIVGEYSDDPTKRGPEKICSFCKKDECFKYKRPTIMERPLEDKFIRVTTVPELNEKGGIRRFIEIVEDITESKKADAALSKAKDDLELRVKERTEELSSTINLLQYEIAERKKAEEELKKTASLISAIRDAQGLFITGQYDHTEIFKRLLGTLVSMTGSEYGFLDEVLQDESGKWYKRSLALSDIAWDEGSRRLYEKLSKSDFEFQNLNNLAGEPAKSGRLVISEDPAHDPRSGGLPEGHPPINSYMGIPMYFGGELVGIAGVANRSGGYTDELADSLEPFTSTCASIISSIRGDMAKHKYTEALKESEGKYRRFFTTVPTGWAYHKIIVDKNNKPVDYIFLEVNDAFEKLTGLKREDIIGKKVTGVLPGIEKDPVDWIGKYGEVALTGNGIRFENYSINLDRWFSVSASSPDKGYFIVIFDDITGSKKAGEQIKRSLEEKEVLLQEIHHRVKNNMTVISSLLRLQSSKITDKKYKEIFDESINRIKAMALIHEKLYSSEDLARIVFGDYLEDIVDDMYIFYGLNSRNITLIKDIDKITLGLDTSIPCGLIVNELLSNSMKHAFPDSRSGEVRLAFHGKDKDEVELTIGDNGVGMPEGLDFRNTDSLGLNLVTTLVKQLQGKIELRGVLGTEFHVTFRRQQ